MTVGTYQRLKLEIEQARAEVDGDTEPGSVMLQEWIAGLDFALRRYAEKRGWK